MNLEQFEDLVDRCGELPSAWPDSVRSEALEFLSESQQAQDVVTEAASLRTLLARAPVEPAPANLANRIVALAGQMDTIEPSFLKERQTSPAPMARRNALLNRIGLPKLFIWIGVCCAAGFASVWSMVAR